jgi:hypothetical protein
MSSLNERKNINLINFQMLFTGVYVANKEHPRWEELKDAKYPPQKFVQKVNLNTVNKYYPFATVFSKRPGWVTIEWFKENLPEGFKIIYKSKFAANAVHKDSGQCQQLVIVDKVEND